MGKLLRELPKQISSKVKEQKPENLMQAAKWADDIWEGMDWNYQVVQGKNKYGCVDGRYEQDSQISNQLDHNKKRSFTHPSQSSQVFRSNYGSNRETQAYPKVQRQQSHYKNLRQI